MEAGRPIRLVHEIAPDKGHAIGGQHSLDLSFWSIREQLCVMRSYWTAQGQEKPT